MVNLKRNLKEFAIKNNMQIRWIGGLCMFALVMAAYYLGSDAGAISMAVTVGAVGLKNGGVADVHGKGRPATQQALSNGGEEGRAQAYNNPLSEVSTREDSEKMLLDKIDEEIVKIRPQSTPLDTIARSIPDIRTTHDMIVRHYSIDTLPLVTKVVTITGAGNETAVLTTDKDELISRDDTLILNIPGYDENGTLDPNSFLELIVINKDSARHPIVRAVNGTKTGAGAPVTVPTTVVADKQIIVSGNAGLESQIQTDAHRSVPTDREQFCQKFMAQIEETTMHKLASKEVDWTFSDNEEEAIYRMKLKMNNTFWMGVKGRTLTDNYRIENPENCYTTGGIWWQAGKEFDFTGIAPDKDSIVNLAQAAFTGNNSAKKKLFICDSTLIGAIEKLQDPVRYVETGSINVAYGLAYSKIVSKFGELLLIHDEGLDTFSNAGFCNPGIGFVLDADFLRKWTFGWRVQDFDLKRAGVADKEARALIETCCLVLRNKDAHMRVYLQK